MANNITTTNFRTIVETTATAIYPTVSPISSSATTTTNARNGMDESNAITIVFGILGFFVALAAIVVAVFYGRRQVQRFDQGWRPLGIHYLPGMIHHRPFVAGTAIPLDSIDRNNPSQPSDASHGSPAASFNTGSRGALHNAPVATMHETV
ncbi:hypothetical protein LTR56_002616 [Elasticomyces elasticus]|nr:hypothetical protein LTR22_013517 [Elasticomyces elasticus]KAK3657102.1 hypothetical protein LTR56_002616 [Elasticomyces elasticus]KAK4926669.1 hypothetical protein LTR49_006351 [Elasticomyces elasticus]KAK5762380.1 hypothetical protein LTS12_007539 [Elasticomyces elasticus]